jgi:hypothetical protein
MPRTTVYNEIEAVVSFDTFTADYGVQGSPEWEEIMPETMEIEGMTMFGRDWSEADLRATFGDQGAEALRSLVMESVEDWEDE